MYHFQVQPWTPWHFNLLPGFQLCKGTEHGYLKHIPFLLFTEVLHVTKKDLSVQLGGFSGMDPPCVIRTQMEGKGAAPLQTRPSACSPLFQPGALLGVLQR